MWLADPKILCQKHLCGEHVEMHMFLGTIKLWKKINGYLENNLFEPRLLFQRHSELAEEMTNRGYNHKSPLTEEECNIVYYLKEEQLNNVVNRNDALEELLSRCHECKKRYDEKEKL